MELIAGQNFRSSKINLNDQRAQRKDNRVKYRDISVAFSLESWKGQDSKAVSLRSEREINKSKWEFKQACNSQRAKESWLSSGSKNAKTSLTDFWHCDESW